MDFAAFVCVSLAPQGFSRTRRTSSPGSWTAHHPSSPFQSSTQRIGVLYSPLRQCSELEGPFKCYVWLMSWFSGSSCLSSSCISLASLGVQPHKNLLLDNTGTRLRRGANCGGKGAFLFLALTANCEKGPSGMADLLAGLVDKLVFVQPLSFLVSCVSLAPWGFSRTRTFPSITLDTTGPYSPC